MDEATAEQIKDHLTNQKYCLARALSFLSEASGFQPEMVAGGIGGLICVYLLASPEAHFLANAILVLYPLLLTYVYTSEKPSRDHLLIYWGLFGILTWFDRALESIPVYYILKIFLLALLFVEPYGLVVVIKNALADLKQSISPEEQSVRTKSPPPEKPDPSTFPPGSLEKEKEKPADAPKACEPAADTKDAPADSAAAPEATTPDTASTAQAITPAQPGGAVAPTSLIDCSDRSRFKGENPMVNDSNHHLHSSSSGSGTNNKEIGPAININDIHFLPMDKLVFNAPFDYENITYHMKIKSNAHHNIAFAVKGNCVPRVVAYPPCGILKQGETAIIAVTVRKFEYNESDYTKDRIVFEWTLLKDSQKDVTKFEHILLQKADLKQRKNIHITYNP